MKHEDQYKLKLFFRRRKITDDSLNFLATLTGGKRGGKTFSPPLGYVTAYPHNSHTSMLKYL